LQAVSGLLKSCDFLPQRWTLDTISKLQQGSHFGSLYLNYMILIAFAGAFFLIAIYKFGKNNSVQKVTNCEGFVIIKII
jgi:ABC-2 type transport system permease protein